MLSDTLKYPKHLIMLFLKYPKHLIMLLYGQTFEDKTMVGLP